MTAACMHAHIHGRACMRSHIQPAPMVANARQRRRSTDPTHTILIRRRFEADIVRRFKKLRRSIFETIAKNDAFGLRVNDPSGRFSFAFPRSADKIDAFMDWLRLEQAALIFDLRTGTPLRSAAQFQWANIYIDSAYRRGIRQASNELRASGAKVSDRWIDTAFNRPVHADRAGLIYTRTFDELRGITEAMDAQISRTLARGLIDGRGPMSIARDIVDRVDKIGIKRARVLARTETISAHADASLNTYREAGLEGVAVVAEFATAGDDSVCEECEDLEGRTFTIDEADGMIPVHPNCLPGGSLVLARDGISAVSKRRYDGDMIVIRTASGRELTCTPNHPVLTNGGWLPAHALDVGGNIISDGGREWKAGFVQNDRENVPARIHDVAESFFQSRQVAAVQMPVAAPDFHGDGLDGDIAIIGTDRELHGSGHAALGKHFDQAAFVMRGEGRRVALAALRALAEFGERSLASARGIVGGGDLLAALGLRHLCPLHALGFALSAPLYAGVAKHSPNDTAANFEFLRDGILGLPGLVGGNDLGRESVVHSFKRHVVGAKNSDDDFMRDAILAHQLASGLAGPVFSDKIVSRNVVSFRGHVFNLETPNHHYSAQGIITHNCRCAWIPVVEDGRGVTLQ